ncbi:allantoinase AllB [Catenuloplanes atrovinosus]|uniref:allantoinase n=1 Tax=Catenuloplanes atrovinosus TaxID=137266 RepID=A0AAE3YHV0_9ACTN|nr:allantoinase AllB [Catenuloplanes atrovinosus]MDR7273964.1 allantoinase [Catenuloplanes atrovinosus]
MTDFDLVVRSQRAITPDGERPAAIAVRDGRIAEVAGYDAPLRAEREEDLGRLALLPGLVDTHVHVNEPGRTEWEGFASATRAAAAGGVTTIIDMPLNSLPPTTTADALEIKRKAAAGQVRVDVGFWGGAVPGNRAVLRPLHDAGVFGFKAFLIDSGVPEFPPLTPGELSEAFREVDALFLVHAEDPDEVGDHASSASYADFVASRPRSAENTAIARVIAAARRTGARAHILHLSSSEAVPLIAAARAEGVRITAETCPHYLALTAEEVPDGATQFKCCPPIRDAANRDALWAALADGVIDLIVSDHSPCTPELKRADTGDFAAAWGGIASLQLGLPIIWTQARQRGHSLSDVVRWMAANPASLAGLDAKGRLAAGADADLVVFDPDSTQRVDVARLQHRNPVSPYHDRVLTGVVLGSWLRGAPTVGEPAGRLLTRGTR